MKVYIQSTLTLTGPWKKFDLSRVRVFEMLGNITGISSSGIFDSLRVFFAVSMYYRKCKNCLVFVVLYRRHFQFFFVFCFSCVSSVFWKFEFFENIRSTYRVVRVFGFWRVDCISFFSNSLRSFIIKIFTSNWCKFYDKYLNLNIFLVTKSAQKIR